MIKRNDKCEYCGKDMISKSIRKRFCSANCRVYSKREKAYAEKYPPKIEVKSAKIIREDDKPIAKFELEVDDKWYDSKAMKLHQDFEKKKFEELPPEFHEQLEKVVTNVENKMKKTPPAGLKGIDLRIWEEENL